VLINCIILYKKRRVILQNIKTIKIILLSLTILIIIFLLLLYIKRSIIPFSLNENEAIKLCKEVVYTKIDKKLSTLFKTSSSKKNKDNIIVNLNFSKTPSKKSKKTIDITTAQCVFFAKHNNEEEIQLKSFFYQDISKNIYLYYNAVIKVKSID